MAVIMAPCLPMTRPVSAGDTDMWRVVEADSMTNCWGSIKRGEMRNFRKSCIVV